MKQLLSSRVLALGLAFTSALLLVATAEASISSHSRTGAVVALRKTTLGAILVDDRGRTLYLFEKDRNGASMCDSTCASYWPPLTSRGTPRAGTGVHQSQLGLTRSRSGMRQVTYAGHPLYRFVGDKRAGQTAGEGLTDFGAEWYAVGSNGRTVENSASNSGSTRGY